MGRSSFIVKACVEVKCSVFMCLFLMCYQSFSVKVYILVTMIGMESFFKTIGISSKLENTNLIVW